MKKILAMAVIILSFSRLAAADEPASASIDPDLTAAILAVAQAKVTQIESNAPNLESVKQVLVSGNKTMFVYVGSFDGCDAVSILWPGRRNFRVCNGKVSERNAEPHRWDEYDGASTERAVLQSAENDGKASAKDKNGFLIFSHVLDTPFGGLASCKTVELIISYDGDLVQQQLSPFCASTKESSNSILNSLR